MFDNLYWIIAEEPNKFLRFYMKQFNYDLLENKKDLIEQDNSGINGRMYHSPNGTYPSITNLLYEIVSKPCLLYTSDAADE